MRKKEPSIAYVINGALYLNITNRCPNNCTFCIRKKGEGLAGYLLWLEKEPSVEEILAAAGDPSPYREVVFCGYGEPLLRPEVVVTVARKLKEKAPQVPIRIDTNGLANLIWGRDVVPELEGLIDAVSISLNAQDAATYQLLCRPVYGPLAYQAVLDFALACRGRIPRVILTVVDLPEVDREACRRIAQELGAEFRVRTLIQEPD